MGKWKPEIGIGIAYARAIGQPIPDYVLDNCSISEEDDEDWDDDEDDDDEDDEDWDDDEEDDEK